MVESVTVVRKRGCITKLNAKLHYIFILPNWLFFFNE